jgi:hypothetical protein
MYDISRGDDELDSHPTDPELYTSASGTAAIMEHNAQNLALELAQEAG